MLRNQIISSGVATSPDCHPPATPRGGPYAPHTPGVVTSAPGPAVQALFVGVIFGDRIVGKLNLRPLIEKKFSLEGVPHLRKQNANALTFMECICNYINIHAMDMFIMPWVLPCPGLEC